MVSFQSETPPQVWEIEEALLDFGTYHSYAECTRMYAELTNRNLLGYSGGVNEQPYEYWHDMAVMRWLSLYVKHVLPLAAQSLPQVSVFDQIRETGSFGMMIKQKDKS